MKELVSSPLFGITISLLAYEFGCYLNKKTKLELLNPLFLSQVLIILILLKFHISVDDYNKGGQLISFFLAPATVVLAVPLYRKIKVLRSNAIPIIAGISLGSTCGMISIILLGKLFHVSIVLTKSLVPKSVTTPIGVAISGQLNGIPAVTVAAILITGIFGAISGPFICKAFKIKDEVSLGVAMGTASHALGTTKAVEVGETEGAMSSLSVGIAGLFTVLVAPVIVKLFILLKLF
jgi:predicted murein hydrolase (TIGR00659 family)